MCVKHKLLIVRDEIEQLTADPKDIIKQSEKKAKKRRRTLRAQKNCLFDKVQEAEEDEYSWEAFNTAIYH